MSDRLKERFSGNKGITPREVRKIYGSPKLSPDSFLCKKVYPVPTVPSHLLSKLQAEKAEKALDDMKGVLAPLWSAHSKIPTEDFQIPARRFKNATGVNAEEVFQRQQQIIIEQLDTH